jgi:nicotinic acid mononucleotide adenylyltransferase
MNNVTVLFPGGFKPITGAHMQLAQRYANNPQVNRVIMLCGPTNSRWSNSGRQSADI